MHPQLLVHLPLTDIQTHMHAKDVNAHLWHCIKKYMAHISNFFADFENTMAINMVNVIQQTHKTATQSAKEIRVHNSNHE